MRRAQLCCFCVFLALISAASQLLSQDSAATTQSSSSSSSSWDNRAGNTNPTRTTSSHSEAQGRTVERQSMQQLGPNGAYETFLDVERESVKVDASTTRVIERRYGRDANGGRRLLQVSEEETKDLPGGEQKVNRTVSNPDVNGSMQVARREIEQTKAAGTDARETTTTVLSPDVNGGFAPSMRIQKREKLDKQGNVIEFRNSTLTPDAAGRWQLNEVREGNAKDGQGGEKTKEERVLRPDSDGKLALVGRTISRESQTSSGEKRETVEKFSRNVPGTAPDANTLHLEERATKVSKSSSDAGSQTLQEIERRNPGLPGDNLSVSERSIDIVRPGMAGTTSETRTIQAVGPASSLNTVWVDTATGKSSTVQVDTKATPQGSQKPQ